jgi:hypothetical protein
MNFKQPLINIKKVFADSGYTGSLIDKVKKETGCKLEIIKRTLLSDKNLQAA